MSSVSGFILFAANSPHVGLDPHPAFAPNPPDEWTPEGWAEAYHMANTLAEAEQESSEDHEARVASLEAGDLLDVDDPDQPMAVRVFSSGDMEVFTDTTRAQTLAYYSVKDIFEAFGMDMPQASMP